VTQLRRSGRLRRSVSVPLGRAARAGDRSPGRPHRRREAVAGIRHAGAEGPLTPAQGHRRAARHDGVTEPGGGSDLQSMTTTARLDGDTYVVDGAKTWISNARRSRLIALLCKADPRRRAEAPRHRAERGAHPRLRLLHRARCRALFPRRLAHDRRRGLQRHPAHRHRRVARQARRAQLTCPRPARHSGPCRCTVQGIVPIGRLSGSAVQRSTAPRSRVCGSRFVVGVRTTAHEVMAETTNESDHRSGAGDVLPGIRTPSTIVISLSPTPGRRL
jgi:hypothetical protein